MYEENPLGELCEEVTVEMSPTSFELIDLVPHTSLELVPSPFNDSPTSLSFESSLAKPMDDDVMTDLNDDLGLVDIKIK